MRAPVPTPTLIMRLACIVPLLALLALAGCGFHLRGASKFPFKTIYVAGSDSTPFGVALRRNLASQENAKLKKLLNMSVNEIELSVRAANCLNNANITTVGQLAQKTEGEMLKYRNFGKKSLNEIKDKLQQLGLGLGMKFDSGLVELPAAGGDGMDGLGAAMAFND